MPDKKAVVKEPIPVALLLKARGITNDNLAATFPAQRQNKSIGMLMLGGAGIVTVHYRRSGAFAYQLMLKGTRNQIATAKVQLDGGEAVWEENTAPEPAGVTSTG